MDNIQARGNGRATATRGARITRFPPLSPPAPRVWISEYLSRRGFLCGRYCMALSEPIPRELPPFLNSFPRVVTENLREKHIHPAQYNSEKASQKKIHSNSRSQKNEKM